MTSHFDRNVMKHIVFVAVSVAVSFGVFGGDLLAEQVSTRYTGDGEHVDFAIEQSAGKAILYLADKNTNAPLSVEKVAIAPDDEGVAELVFNATERPGVYEIEAEGKLPEGNLVVSGAVSDDIELYEEEFHPTGDSHAGHDHMSGAKGPSFGSFPVVFVLLAAGCFVLGVVVGRMLGRVRAAQMSALLLVGVLISFAESSRVLASEGHSHAELSISTRGGDQGIYVSKKSQFLMNIRTQRAKQQPIELSRQTIGHAMPAPMFDSIVKAAAAGVFIPERGIRLGVAVKKGQVLGHIENVGRFPVRASIDGTIVASDANNEMRVDAGDSLFRITETKVLWIDAEVFQKDLIAIRDAQKVVVNFDGMNPIYGKILTLNTLISEQTLTGKVYVEIENPSGKIAPGSIGTVSFVAAPSQEQVYVLPRGAVLPRGGEMVVFVQTGPELFEQKTVVAVSAPTPDNIIVKSGLTEDDRVVVTGNYQLLTAAN